MAIVEFFFDCSSPWTYLAFSRIEGVVEAAGAELIWKPILVGGVFNAVNEEIYHQRDNPHPLKHPYSRKDLQDWARYCGVEIGWPEVFPVRAVRPMRGALVALDRGLLPAFGRSFDHPVTKVAFELDVGQLSDIFIRESQGSKRYYLVYCLRKIPGREVTYTDVKAELDREIEAHPLTAIEFRAAVMCLKARMETLNSEQKNR